MALTIPNLDKISKENPKLGESLKRVQDYTNLNVPAATGNQVKPPTFVNPAQRPG